MPLLCQASLRIWSARNRCPITRLHPLQPFTFLTATRDTNMSAFYSTIFIPAYDHAREVENMRGRCSVFELPEQTPHEIAGADTNRCSVTLARWNAQAFGSKPHPPHVAYYDTIAGQRLCASFQNIQLNETQQSTGLFHFSALPEEVLSKVRRYPWLSRMANRSLITDFGSARTTRSAQDVEAQ